MLTKHSYVLAPVLALALAGLARADDAPVVIPPISVSDQVAPTAAQPQSNPVTSITQPGLKLLGGSAQTSVYGPLDMAPSVLVQSPDPYGISLTRNISIRGKDDFHITRTIDGLPVGAIVGGDMDLLDLENVQRLDIYRSGLQANEGLGFSNTSGAVNELILGPQDAFGATARQAFGANRFYRAYARADSGALATGTKFFVSGSIEDANKWKGLGDSNRKSAMLGLSQRLGDRVQVDVDAIYNTFNGNLYRGLTYAQATNPAHFYTYDYATALTGNAATDVYYYGFNRVKQDTFAVLGDVKVSDVLGGRLRFKPYYYDNTGAQYSASGSNVQIWRQENYNTGGVVEYSTSALMLDDATLGYWFQVQAAPPPPTDQRKFVVNSAGGLNFASWSTLSRMDPFYIHSPYLQLTKNLPTRTLITLGARYMALGVPSMQWYRTAGLTDATYDQVWAQNPAADTNAHTDKIWYGEFLPNAGVTQLIVDGLDARASYARKFGRPDWGPQSSQFLGSEAAFVAQGVTLQKLMSSLKPELADQFDVGVSYTGQGFRISPNFFYSKHRNKEVLVSDPSIGNNISYYVSTGDTTEYGAELEGDWRIVQVLSIFGSATLSHETFDGDITSVAGVTTLAIKGKQLPNSPTQMVKLGATFSYDELSFTALARYVGKRWGDAANTQPVQAFGVGDVYATWDLGRSALADDLRLHGFTVGVAFTNVLDRKYIGEIAPPSNLENPGSTTAYYFAPPRTLSGFVSATF